MGGYYDKSGQQITLDEWVRLLYVDEYKRIAHTTLSGYVVSTVWLGLDHNYFSDSPPLIFETMVFGHTEDGTDLDDRLCERYSTEAAAREGHESIVRLVELSVEQQTR